MKIKLTDLFSLKTQTVTLSELKAVIKRAGLVAGYHGGQKVYRHPTKTVAIVVKFV